VITTRSSTRVKPCEDSGCLISNLGFLNIEHSDPAVQERNSL
jgi:hypothetical protein